MTWTREDVRDAVDRAGEQHMQALRSHHEDAYPESRPTPGDICRAEADRLNELGLGNSSEFELLETRVERVEPQVRITHLLRYAPLDVRLLTEPFTGYA
jgi:hypothetical protein